jgi:cytochrome c biogenesis protein CcdA
MEGFFLGISSGTVCLAHCLPVMVPYFLGEANGVKRSVLSLIQFLLGRLTGYVLFGCVAWIAGRFLFHSSAHRELLFGVIYLLLSLLMAIYGLLGSKKKCRIKRYNGVIGKFVTHKKWVIAVAMGFLTGINFCPPFLLAFSSSAHVGDSLFQSVLYFVLFFLGTAIYFIPIVLLGFGNLLERLRTIGKMTAIVMALYFFYKGTTMIAGGVIVS